MKSYKLKNGDVVWRIVKATSLRFMNFDSINVGMVVSDDPYVQLFIKEDVHFKTKTITSTLIRTMYKK